MNSLAFKNKECITWKNPDEPGGHYATWDKWGTKETMYELTDVVTLPPRPKIEFTEVQSS